MKLVQNNGSDRVIDFLLPHLAPGSRLASRAQQHGIQNVRSL